MFEFLSVFNSECEQVLLSWEEAQVAGFDLKPASSQDVELSSFEGEIDSLVKSVFLGVQQRVKRNSVAIMQGGAV